MFRFLFNALMACVLVAIVLYTRTHWLPDPEPVANAEKTSDYQIQQFQVTQYDEQGQLDYRLKGTEFHHYTDETGQLFAPQGEFFDREQRGWQVSGRHGEVDIKRKTLLLRDEVMVTQEDAEYDLSLTTDDVLIDQENQVLSTEADVVVTIDNGRLEGRGLRGDLENQTVKILHDVKTYYRAD